jgi:cysteine desulfurase
LNVPGIVGFGAAASLSVASMDEEQARIARLRDRLEAGLLARLPDVTLNGSRRERFSGNLNLRFAGVGSDALMMDVRDVAMSSGSACTSASVEPSHVLAALGLSKEAAHSSIRFGVGRFNTEEEIDFAVEAVASAVARLRAARAVPAG